MSGGKYRYRYSFHYSVNGSIVQWDDDSFTDMRSCEYRGAVSQIEELITKLDKTAGEMTIRDFEMVDVEGCPGNDDDDGDGDGYQYDLRKANAYAKLLCQSKLDHARGGSGGEFEWDEDDKYGNDPRSHPLENELRLAKDSYDIYKMRKGGKIDKRMDIRSTIGWGDDTVNEEHCKIKEDDGTASFSVRVVYFVDPWGSGVYNVAEQRITVEVVRSTESGDKGEVCN